jgi:hypothetical protein
MPNKPQPHKRNSPRSGGASLQKQTGPLAVGAILARAGDLLPELTQQIERHDAWRAWLAERLPPPLSGKLAGVVERDGCLILLACSAAWGTRLRYALRELAPEIRAHAPGITAMQVRVLPRG